MSTIINIHDGKPSLEEALEHYGVKGMKWGVRRSDDQLGKSRKTKRVVFKKTAPNSDARREQTAKIGKTIATGAAFAALAIGVHATAKKTGATRLLREQEVSNNFTKNVAGAHKNFTDKARAGSSSLNVPNTFSGFSVDPQGNASPTTLRQKPQTSAGADWVVSPAGEASMADWRK